MKTGSCLCGAVSFEVHGPFSEAIACHCGQCRKQSGHYWTSAHVADKDLKFKKKAGLKWFKSSKMAKRGFCKNCGSVLFWKKIGDKKVTSVSAGSIDGKSGIKLGGHIFVKDAGDYYKIAGGHYRKP